MTAPASNLVRARIVVREVVRFERTVLMTPEQLATYQQQLASSIPGVREDVAAAMFDNLGADRDHDLCEEESQLLEVSITEAALATAEGGGS